MARCSAVRDSLSVYFVVFLTLSAVSASQDNFYNVDNAQSNEFVTFEFVGHHVHRRQASDIVPVENKYPPSTTTPPKTTTSQFPTYVKLGNKTLEENNTETSVAQLPEKGAKSTTPAPAPATTASVPVQTAFEKLNMSTPVADEDSISISKFSDSTVNFNDTLKQHNITVTQVDNHIYYNSSFKTDADTGRYFWVNMTHKNDVKISELLSKSHRRAATVRLSFDFPFYGHIIRNVTIATGGFLYTGDYVHSWLAATQYIAPLMANFDTSLSEDSYIKYYDNGTAFTVLWENVSLQDRPTEGKFTFQATLHSTGDIVFVYQNVPVIIEKIQDNLHPVKVGLSDAYIIDRTIYFVRRKTIYEYHRVNFRKEDIKNWTVIYLTALPTCPGIKDCQSCLTNELANFKCTWCPSINKCSNGLDRSRQEWLTKGCDKRQIKHESECSQIFGPDPFDDHDLTYSHEPNFDHIAEDPMRASSRISHDSTVVPAPPVKMGVSTIVAILFIVALVGALGIWIMYAYRNPHTTSGQMLIRYRPSQWSWRRGEARYTAATIHM